MPTFKSAPPPERRRAQEHGIMGYKYGCKCLICKRANQAYYKPKTGLFIDENGNPVRVRAATYNPNGVLAKVRERAKSGRQRELLNKRLARAKARGVYL